MENQLPSPALLDVPPGLQAAMQEIWRAALSVAAATPPGDAPNACPAPPLSLPAAAPTSEVFGMYQIQLETEREFNRELLAVLAKKDESLKHLRTEYGGKIDLLTTANKDKGKQISTLEKTIKALESETVAARQRAEAATVEAATLRGQVEALQAELKRPR